MSLKTILRGAGASIARLTDPEALSVITEEPRTGAGSEGSPGLIAPPVEALELALREHQAAFTEADAKRDALRSALATAREALATATQAVDQQRSAFGDALAEQELHGTAAPSRARLAAAEAAQRDAEDRVNALERRRPEVERIWRSARLDVLAAEEATRHARNTVRQAAIDALRPERAAIDVREGALFAAMQADLDAIMALRREADDLRRKG